MAFVGIFSVLWVAGWIEMGWYAKPIGWLALIAVVLFCGMLGKIADLFG